MIGFGEAAKAFVSGWRKANDGLDIYAYDIKTGDSDQAIADAKWRDYRDYKINGRADPGAGSVDCIFSLVTAEQTLAAASDAGIAKGSFYFDCNSCAPETKIRAAELIESAGGRYVDVAVMAAVGPDIAIIPMLICGPHAADAGPLLQALGMNVTIHDGEIGRASSIKMIRSIMVKGLEALALECVLAGRKAGVEAEVIASLETTYPGFGWQNRIGHMLERSMTHGIRRAEEMREVVRTVEHLGIASDMSRAIVTWQQHIGEMVLSTNSGDYRQLADQILKQKEEQEKS